MFRRSIEEVDHFRSGILLAAGQMYDARKRGEVVDPMASRVQIIARSPEDGSLGDPHDVGLAQARVDTAARFALRLAELQDVRDAAGPIGRTAACAELALTRVFEAPYAAPLLRPGGIVETMRGGTK
jgi:hypothetical protein